MAPLPKGMVVLAPQKKFDNNRVGQGALVFRFDKSEVCLSTQLASDSQESEQCAIQ